MSDNWKQDFANEAEKALFHSLVTETVDEYRYNMKNNYGIDIWDGLPKLGLMKVMMAVALAARAQAANLDPNLLRLSNEEATQAQIDLALSMMKAGKPVLVVEVPEKR